MKLNWFSPLPPAKSGIALDFLRTILPALSSAAELTLWTDQTQWARSLKEHARVKTFNLQDMPWVELNRADMTFFNLGNNHLFHGTIWEVSRLLPGITILHDSQLNEFFDNWLRLRPASRIGLRSSDLAVALENSLGVIVHTKGAYDQLNPLNRWIVAHVPLAFSPPSAAPIKRSREDRKPPYRLIVFGFMNPNRRLLSLLEALSSHKDKEKFRLEIYGELWDSSYVTEHLAKCGLRDHVAIRGFVSEETLNDALASADLAVNLRYPTLGEASTSQLRIWSHELPSIVTREGWFAELPETAVAHVSPENEVAEIQKHLSNFLANPAKFHEMGIAGRRLLSPRHAPQTYVDALLNLSRQVIEFRPRSAAHYLARSTGESMTPWIGSITSDEPLRRVAEEMLILTR